MEQALIVFLDLKGSWLSMLYCTGYVITLCPVHTPPLAGIVIVGLGYVRADNLVKCRHEALRQIAGPLFQAGVLTVTATCETPIRICSPIRNNRDRVMYPHELGLQSVERRSNDPPCIYYSSFVLLLWPVFMLPVVQTRFGGPLHCTVL